MSTHFEGKYTQGRHELHGKPAFEKAGIPVPEDAISPTTLKLAEMHKKALRALGLLSPSPTNRLSC